MQGSCHSCGVTDTRSRRMCITINNLKAINRLFCNGVNAVKLWAKVSGVISDGVLVDSTGHGENVTEYCCIATPYFGNMTLDVSTLL